MTQATLEMLTEKIRTSGGGFTIDTNTDTEITHGYAVAAYLARSASVTARWMTSADLAAYIAINADALAIEGNVFGGWHDADTHTVWFDVSTVTTDLAQAVEIARINNQIAIFDLTNGVEINTGGTGS